MSVCSYIFGIDFGCLLIRCVDFFFFLLNYSFKHNTKSCTSNILYITGWSCGRQRGMSCQYDSRKGGYDFIILTDKRSPSVSLLMYTVSVGLQRALLYSGINQLASGRHSEEDGRKNALKTIQRAVLLCPGGFRMN